MLKSDPRLPKNNNAPKLSCLKSIVGKILKSLIININFRISEIFVLLPDKESPLKMIKNTFYYTLKALFVLMIFKFLS